MSDRLTTGSSFTQEIASLRRGIKLKDEAYTCNILLIIIRQLKKGNENSTSYSSSGSTCSLIEQVFETFPGSQEIVVNALVIMNLMISVSTATHGNGSSNPIWKQILTRPEPCSGLIIAIANHLHDPAIAAHSLKLILSLSSQEGPLKKLLDHQHQRMRLMTQKIKEGVFVDAILCFSVSDVLLKLMRDHIKNSQMMEQICHILYNLTYEDDDNMSEECRNYLSELGVCELLLLRLGGPEGLLCRLGTENVKEGSIVLEDSASVSHKADADITGQSPQLDTESIARAQTGQDLSIPSASDQCSSDYEGSKHGCTQTGPCRPTECNWQSVPTMDIGLAKWGMRALGSLCRHHVQNQEAFHLLKACEMVMHVKKTIIEQSDARDITNRDDSSFLESFCWAVGNLADPESGYILNQEKLLEVGACEAVLEALKDSHRARGHLTQEGCRALRHLCNGNKESLQRMHRLGVCNILLDIVRNKVSLQRRPSPSSSRSGLTIKLSPDDSSTVQWAWFAVSALCRDDDERSGCDSIKREIRSTFSGLDTCNLLRATCYAYGTSSSTTAGSADVIQWCFAAMAALTGDPSIAKQMLSHQPSSSIVPVPGISDDRKSVLDTRLVNIHKKVTNTAVDSSKNNYSFFMRAISSGHSSNSSFDTLDTKGTIDLEGASEKAMSNTLVVLQAMTAHLNNEDVVEEFCNVICSLISTSSEKHPKSLDNLSDDSTSRLFNRQLLIAANTIEHLVKILVAHGRVVSEDDIEAAVVMGSVFGTISQLILPQSLTGIPKLTDPVEDSSCVDRLVASGLLRVLPRILAQPYALAQFSSIALCGLQLLHDIACCRSPYHEVLAKSNVAVSLVALLQAHVKWKTAATLAVQTMSSLATGSHSRGHAALLQRAGCCSALVQAVCVHYRGGETSGRRGEELPDSSMVLLQNLVQCICDLLDANRVSPTELIEYRASFIKEGAHEAMALVMRTLKISSGAFDAKTKNVVVSLCIDVICRLSALPCSVLERLDRQSLSLSCLSLLFLSNSSSILNPATVPDTISSSSAQEVRLQCGIQVSIGSYAVRGTGIISKDNEIPALGTNVCSSLGCLVNQAINLLFPAVISPSSLATDSLPSSSDASTARLGTSDNCDGETSFKTVAPSTDDEASNLLKSCCAAVEGLVASHRHHRWSLAQAGVSRSLLHALTLCSECLEARADFTLMDLATAICLAIGSISKDSEESAVSKGSRGELDLVSQALPVFCRLLDICAQLEVSGSPSAVPSSESETDKFVQVAAVGIADHRFIASTSLSAAICRAVSHIAAAQGRHAILFYYQRNIESAPGGNGLEGCVLKALSRTHHSLAASYECCLAVAELALNDADSAHRMCAMGINRKLAEVFFLHISSVQFEATLSSSTASQIVDHEVEVFCMVWCRALYALLKVLGRNFFSINEEDATKGFQPPSDKLSPESLTSMLLNVVDSDWASSAVAASVCMAFSALIGACSSQTRCRPDSVRLEITILGRIMCDTLQKHVVQADWFTLSLQQAAHSISFSKSAGGGVAGSPTFSTAVTAAGAGGVAYWCSVFLYQLIASAKTDEEHLGVTTETSLQLQIRSKCLSLNLCDMFHRALGKFSQEESVMAACFMAISALLSETAVESGHGIRALSLTSAVDQTVADSLLAANLTEANEQDALLLSINDARKRFNSLGLGPMIVDTLKEYPSSKHVTDWCLRCMCLLFEHSEETVHRMSSAGICEMLPVCMQAHQSSVFASISGCLAIYRIIHSSHTSSTFTLTPPTHQQSSAYAVRLGGAGACEAVMSVFNCHGGNASAIESASRALAALSFASKGNAGWLGPLGACEALLVAHDRHYRNLEVVSAVWNAIGTLCSYNRERLSNLGVAQRIILSLQLHFQSELKDTSFCVARSSVASSAAFAIGRLCEPLHGPNAPTCLINRTALCAAGCCGVLTSVLRMEYLNIAASTNICRAISTLCNGLRCSQERSEFGQRGVADALAMAMKQHIGHEEAALYSCHAIRALCSYGDLANQRLLRRAGICELVALILHESLQIAAPNPQVSNADSTGNNNNILTRRGARESEGLFSQILSRARAYSQPLSLSGKSASGPPSSPPVGPVQAALLSSEVLSSRPEWKSEWRDKARVSLAAIRAICCLSCASSSLGAVDHAGSNINAKALFGSKGVLEAMVELGTSGCVQSDGASTAIPSLSQWITLALCHLIDPSDDICHDNDSDAEDIDFLKPVHKGANRNLSRLCFCNRTGEFLVNSILLVTASNSTVPTGDADALVYNALSIAVCMCEDKVGSHRVFSAEGFSRMILQLITRYSVPVASTEATWLLLLTFSLASSAALSTIVSEKLVQGGILRLLAAALLTQQLPSATGVIRQLSSDPSRPTPQQTVSNFNGDASSIVPNTAPGTPLYGEAISDDRIMLGNVQNPGSNASDESHQDTLASSQIYQLMVRSDFEATSFIAPIKSAKEGGETRHFSTAANYRITSGLRSVINNATTSISDGSKVDNDFDADNSDVLTLALAKEGCCALSSLLSASLNMGSTASETLAPLEGKGSAAGRARAFSSAIGLYRDSSSGGIAGLGAGNAGNLITSMNALVLVADSSLMFFSNERSSAQNKARQNDMESDVTRGKVNGGVIGRQSPIEEVVVPLLLPAVEELRNSAAASLRHMQQLLQRPA